MRLRRLVSEEPKVVDVLPSVRVGRIRGWKLGKIFDGDGQTQAAHARHLVSKKERVWWNRVESRLERFRPFVVGSVVRWLG